MVSNFFLNFRSCLICNHLGVTSLSRFLCRECENTLLDKKIILEMRESWSSWSLLRWRSDTESVGRLIHSLKGDGDSLRFRFLAQILARQILPLMEGRKNAVFIPAPSRNHGHPDHAELFAQELCKQLGGTVQQWLKRSSNEEQKGLSREDRQQAKLLLLEPQSLEKHQNCPIFFIDDVIVSGGTAQAAYLALKKPKYFTVLTLATRPRLQKGVKVVINSDA